MKIIEGVAFQADIYVGFYDSQRQKTVGSIEETHRICQKFCDDVPYCVSVAPVHFIYHKGNEKGVKVTLINYLRFPEPRRQIIVRAKNLAKNLMDAFSQMRVSIITTTGVIMLSSENAN